MVKIGNYDYQKSTRKDKKLMTKVNGKTIHFGQVGYKHFKDKTGLLAPELNHGDKERRKRYLARAKGIKDKDGNLTANKKESPNYHSLNILWS